MSELGLSHPLSPVSVPLPLERKEGGRHTRLGGGDGVVPILTTAYSVGSRDSIFAGYHLPPVILAKASL
jgi:hypothetical protein